MRKLYIWRAGICRGQGWGVCLDTRRQQEEVLRGDKLYLDVGGDYTNPHMG